MGLLHVKDGVEFRACTPELVEGIITTSIQAYIAGIDLVITSGTEGIHPAGGKYDPHYLGYAFDMRSRTIHPHKLPTFLATLRAALGPQWVVVLEPDHIHLQHQKFKEVRDRERSQPTTI